MAIQTLEAHTVHSNERWVGHPSIPQRVFGPAKYLNEPPTKLTKPQTTTMPQSDDDNPTFNTQPTSLQAGDFQATRHEKFFPRFKEQSLGQRFAHWFDFTFADYNTELKQKAIRAGQKAICCTLFKAPAQHSGFPGTGQNQQPAGMVYDLETWDIQYKREQGSRKPFTIDQAISWQEGLDNL